MLEAIKRFYQRWKSILLWTLLPFTIMPLVVVGFGMAVLLDVEQSGYMAQTQFGQLYTAMTQ